MIWCISLLKNLRKKKNNKYGNENLNNLPKRLIPSTEIWFNDVSIELLFLITSNEIELVKTLRDFL